MFNRDSILVLACYCLMCGLPSMVNAKPSAPLDIENINPKIIRPGEEVRSVIRFTARADLQHVTVSLSPYSGIELLSPEQHIEFTDLKRNDTRKIKIRIRLTNKTGYLSVFATTTNMEGGTQTRSIAIRYESAVEAVQKKRSQGIRKKSPGEKLILLPGSSR